MLRVLWTLPLVALLVSIPGTASAAGPPSRTFGSAVVDGNIAEWDLTEDFFANMYRAGKPDKPLEARAYFRYNCAAQTMYVLVLTEPGVPGLVDSTATAWIAIDAQSNKVVNSFSGNDGIPPDFEWVDLGYDGNPMHARGYEASFTLLPGIYEMIVHLNVFDDGKSQTAATPGFPGSGPIVEIDCPPTPVEPASWSKVKALFR